MENLQKGGIIRFGRYPQTKDPSAGPEPIEWIVLDVSEKSAKLISRYALTARPYNKDGFFPVTWESCTLRSWLNGEFLNTAFTAEEQRLLETVTVEAEYGFCVQGEDTLDKVYIPDAEDAEQYFASAGERICIPTEKAKSEGAYTETDHGGCWWWLRTPSISMPNFVWTVNTDGSFDKDGFPVDAYGENDDDNIAVRPVIVLRCAKRAGVRCQGSAGALRAVISQ